MTSPAASARLLLGAFALFVGCVGSSDGMEALTAEDIPEEEGWANQPAAPAAPTLKPPSAEAAAESPATRFVGTYKWVGGVTEQRALWGKIEGIANTFNFIAKPIVRDKLAAGNQISKEIRIESDGKTILIKHEKQDQQAPMDGTPVKIRATNGEMMDMSFELKENEIVQTFKGNAKGRVNRYVIEDGKLVMHVRIHAAQLPKELVYELTYEKQGEDVASR
jgi:hypothetical protein